MDWRTLPIVAFDVESTGLNPFTDDDRIIEFAAVVIRVGPDGKVTDIKRHGWLFNPERPIPAKVVQLTRIDDDAVADAPLFKQRAAEIKELLGLGILVAHNLAFDRNMLRAEFDRCGLNWRDPVAEVDTLPLSRKLYPDEKSHKLGDVCKRFGIDLDNAHRATDDAQACGEVMVEMLRQNASPSDLLGMLDWADALGRPPDNPHIQPSGDGPVIFTDGPHEGEPVENHPLRVHWMTMARERRDSAWAWRYPESLRRWCERFLRVRSAGTGKSSPKSAGPTDWGLDSNSIG